jgi:hypothetical protein
MDPFYVFVTLYFRGSCDVVVARARPVSNRVGSANRGNAQRFRVGVLVSPAVDFKRMVAFWLQKRAGWAPWLGL